jgi:hypothetical protein
LTIRRKLPGVSGTAGQPGNEKQDEGSGETNERASTEP